VVGLLAVLLGVAARDATVAAALLREAQSALAAPDSATGDGALRRLDVAADRLQSAADRLDRPASSVVAALPLAGAPGTPSGVP
jgi:hypothetical protein